MNATWPDNPSYVLGLDGGGTKTVCVLLDPWAQVRGRVQAGPSNYQTMGLDAAYHSLETAIRQTLESLPPQVRSKGIEIEGLGMGLAGVGRPEDVQVVQGLVERLQAHFGWSLSQDRIVVESDAAIALIGGVAGDAGIVAIAGTGSMVYGRNPLGETKRAGGWGYLLGDEGSGYQIALRGLQAALRSWDGRLESTRLVGDFQTHLGLQGLDELVEVVYRRGWGVKEIAALSAIVDRAAVEGDGVANHIIDEAVEELVLATRVVADALFSPDEAFEVVTMGGVWQGKSNLRQRFAQSLKEIFTQVSTIDPRQEPAWGAGWMVLRELKIKN